MIENLKKKYHIHIVDDSFWHPMYGKYIKRYKIYTADGCPWENGLSYKSLLAECKKYGDTFLAIAANVRR